jgi:hypothetical protein
MINYISEYNDMVKTLAAEYSRKYSMIEQDDIAQELWVWFVSHPRKYKEWSALPQKDMDKLVAKSLRNAALKYCEYEKSKKTGYDVNDLYYYDASVIETFLPSIISESYEMPASLKDLGNSVKSLNISDGMNWLSLRSDIASGFYKLSEAKQNVLRLRFSVDSPDWAALAKDMDSTPDGARMKVQRAISSLIKHLGGWHPYNDTDTQEETTTDKTADSREDATADITEE